MNLDREMLKNLITETLSEMEKPMDAPKGTEQTPPAATKAPSEMGGTISDEDQKALGAAKQLAQAMNKLFLSDDATYKSVVDLAKGAKKQKVELVKLFAGALGVDLKRLISKLQSTKE